MKLAYFSKPVKPSDSQSNSANKTDEKGHKGTFQTLAEKSFDVKAFNNALRAQLKIDQPQKATEGSHRLPVKLKETYLWSFYGDRKHPDTGEIKFHKGIDLGGKNREPVRATADGTVIFSGLSKTYGKHVIIRHKDNTRTLYAHLAFKRLTKGQEVKAGQLVGGVGNTGATGGRKHLHFEISRPATSADKNLRKNHRGEVLLNPLEYFPKKEVATLIKKKEAHEASSAKNNNKKDKSTHLAMDHGSGHSH